MNSKFLMTADDAHVADPQQHGSKFAILIKEIGIKSEKVCK